jgi:hypothetical protein
VPPQTSASWPGSRRALPPTEANCPRRSVAPRCAPGESSIPQGGIAHGQAFEGRPSYTLRPRPWVCYYLSSRQPGVARTPGDQWSTARVALGIGRASRNELGQIGATSNSSTCAACRRSWRRPCRASVSVFIAPSCWTCRRATTRSRREPRRRAACSCGRRAVTRGLMTRGRIRVKGYGDDAHELSGGVASRLHHQGR